MPPGQAALLVLQTRAAAGLDIAKLLACEDKDDRGLRPTVEQRRWSEHRGRGWRGRRCNRRIAAGGRGLFRWRGVHGRRRGDGSLYDRVCWWWRRVVATYRRT